MQLIDPVTGWEDVAEIEGGPVQVSTITEVSAVRDSLTFRWNLDRLLEDSDSMSSDETGASDLEDTH